MPSFFGCAKGSQFRKIRLSHICRIPGDRSNTWASTDRVSSGAPGRPAAQGRDGSVWCARLRQQRPRSANAREIHTLRALRSTTSPNQPTVLEYTHDCLHIIAHILIGGLVVMRSAHQRAAGDTHLILPPLLCCPIQNRCQQGDLPLCP